MQSTGMQFRSTIEHSPVCMRWCKQKDIPNWEILRKSEGMPIPRNPITNLVAL